MSKFAPLYEVEFQGEITHHKDLVGVHHFITKKATERQVEIDQRITDMEELLDGNSPLSDDEVDEMFEELAQLRIEDALASLIVRKWDADQGRWVEVGLDVS